MQQPSLTPNSRPLKRLAGSPTELRQVERKAAFQAPASKSITHTPNLATVMNLDNINARQQNVISSEGVAIVAAIRNDISKFETKLITKLLLIVVNFRILRKKYLKSRDVWLTSTLAKYGSKDSHPAGPKIVTMKLASYLSFSTVNELSPIFSTSASGASLPNITNKISAQPCLVPNHLTQLNR